MRRGKFRRTLGNAPALPIRHSAAMLPAMAEAVTAFDRLGGGQEE